MSDDYKQIAALALAKCAAYDPWFPKASQATVDAWAEAIGEYRLSLPDVMAGVKLAYRDNGSGFKPLPKDIVQAARLARKDRRERDPDRQDYEAVCNSKSDDTRALASITRRIGPAVGKDVPE